MNLLLTFGMILKYGLRGVSLFTMEMEEVAAYLTEPRHCMRFRYLAEISIMQRSWAS